MSILNRIKHWGCDLWRYPALHPLDVSYDTYWLERSISNVLNSFQKKRADTLLSLVGAGDSILDVGCGDGRILAYLALQNPSLHLSGVDGSPAALNVARRRGLNVRQADIRDPKSFENTPVDYVIFFEVLEHMFNAEELLAWAMKNARKEVVFSVPNTGFLFHRLRLLFGRFPLQWRAHPSEHVRFWTARDMHWWLRHLGYSYKMYFYEGIPLLNRVWPSLFAAGLFIRLKKMYH